MNKDQAMEKILSSVTGSGPIKEMFLNLQDTFIGIALVVAGSMAALNLVAIVYKAYVSSNEGLSWDVLRPGVMRMVLLFAMVWAYPGVTTLIDSVFNGIYNSVRKEIPSDGTEDYIKARTMMVTKMENDMPSVTGAVVDAVSSGNPNEQIKESVTSRLMIGVHSILAWLLAIVGTMVSLIAWAQIQVLKVIGPLALALAIFEVWGDGWSKWLNAYIGGYATMIVILIFTAIQNGLSGVMVTQGTGNLTAVIMIDLVIVGMYLSAFKFGSYLVGEDVGSTVTSNIMRVATVAQSRTIDMVSNAGDMLNRAGSSKSIGGDSSSKGEGGNQGKSIFDKN